MEQKSTVLRSQPRSALPLLAVGVFAVGTEGLVFAGLLPALAADLGVSIGAAGQVTTVFALAYALSAPLLAMLAETWRPRSTLLAGFTLFTAGNALTASAPTLGSVLCWRVVTAAGASLITPTSTLVAATLATPHRRGRAISIVMTGLTLATAAGAPLGTLIGGAYGWRCAIWAITGLGVLVAIAIALGIPALPGRPRRGLRDRMRPLAVPAIRRVLATTLIGFVAVYLFYAYVSVVYRRLASESGFLAVILLVIGIAGVIGNLAAGTLTDRYGARGVVTGALIVTAAAIILAGLASDSRVLVLVTAALYGIAAWAIAGPQQHRLLAADTGRTGLPVALNSSAMYLAIAIAGALGGVLVPAGHWPLLVSGALAALVAAGISTRAEARATQEARATSTSRITAPVAVGAPAGRHDHPAGSRAGDSPAAAS
ncbi:Predicted arabinose efflux permease, MFS family [Propionibacterium cyclohexanicum]|uniref:Predicted arabinose efflux permease, MFS family n=1 Tax=Propionibacterium cyclohexanicum TaxID=64702 RepID=A0A1H9U434_9ACTN|nr:MFS transporter [Propionibacterium cyclohexanicum]SES04139.1 Predicted arabinose efflux permease, MFS family [Propionibacterium cyclohexanicum]